MNVATRDLFRRSLNGEFGEDVKLNNVIRLLPIAEFQEKVVRRDIREWGEYFSSHPKDPALPVLQKEAQELKELSEEGRAYLKEKGLLAYDEQPKYIWCEKCGKALVEFHCPAGHPQHDMLERMVDSSMIPDVDINKPPENCPNCKGEAEWDGTKDSKGNHLAWCPYCVTHWPAANRSSENLRNARIKCAAIRYDGKIYEGQAHCEIGLQMLRDGVCPRPYPGGEAQGFVTEKGTFLSRYQALRVAANAKQVVMGETINSEDLYSEDLRQPKK